MCSKKNDILIYIKKICYSYIFSLIYFAMSKIVLTFAL